MTLRELLEAARTSGDPGALVAAIPYARSLGVTIARREVGLEARLAGAPHLIGNSLIGALHGGTIGALLESTAVVTLMLETESLQIAKTVSLTIEYLRTGRNVDTFARAEIHKLGRRIANVRAWAWQEDRGNPIAAANVILLLQPPSAGEPVDAR